MKVDILKQFSVFMPNRPGALSGLARVFSEKNIDILGLASEVRDDSGVVRIAVGADADVSAILSQAGFSSVETNLISVDLEGRPGELHRIARFRRSETGGTGLTALLFRRQLQACCRFNSVRRLSSNACP